MKLTGIIRRIDDLGRIVIPKEIRRNMGIKEGDPLKICIDKESNGITFIPYRVADELCEEIEKIVESYADDIKENTKEQEAITKLNEIIKFLKHT